MSADRVEIGNCIIAGIAEGGTCLEQMSEIVTRLELAGFIIVPREPTPEMISAGMARIPEDGCEYEDVEDAYRAMVAANTPAIGKSEA